MANAKGKWLYFCLFAWFASQGRFTAIFLEDRGLSQTEIGSLLSIRNVIGIVATPIVSYLADYFVLRGNRYGREGFVLILSLLSTFVFCLHAVPELTGKKCSFVYFVIIRLFYAVFMSPIYSLVGGIVLKNISDLRIDKEAFGQDRLFGAISWAVVSVILGITMDIYKSSSVMYLFAVATQILLVVCLCALTGGPADIGSDVEMTSRCAGDNNDAYIRDDITKRPSTHIYADDEEKKMDTGTSGVIEVLHVLYSFFDSPEKAMFTILYVILTMGTSIVENLVFLFFRDSLDSSYTTCGVSVAVTVLFEIPIFQYSKSLLRMFGRRGLLVIACAAYIVRVVGYTVAPSAWWVLLLEPMHGVTFGCACTASVDFAATMAPTNLDATSQAVLGSLSGMGGLVGTTLGAFVEDKYGPHMLYRGAAVVVSITTFLYLVSSWCIGLSEIHPGEAMAAVLDDNNTILRYKRVPVGEEGSDKNSTLAIQCDDEQKVTVF